MHKAYKTIIILIHINWSLLCATATENFINAIKQSNRKHIQNILEIDKLIHDFTISDFIWNSDNDQIFSILKKNWNNCVSEDEHYDPSLVVHMFKNKKSVNYPNQELIIKVAKNDDNKVIGFITYTQYASVHYNNSSGRPYPLNAILDSGHIEVLAIDEPYRRFGAASMLIRYAISDLTNRGVNTINIAVKNNNEPARQLYKKLGFKIDKYYDDNTTILATTSKIQ